MSGIFVLWLLSRSDPSRTYVPTQDVPVIPPGCVYVSDTCHWPTHDGWSAEINDQWLHVYVKCGPLLVMASQHASQGPALDMKLANRLHDELMTRCQP